MTVRIHAKRYAKAIFELAMERGELERWQADLKEILKLKEDERLTLWLESPKISFSDKACFLKEELKGISPMALNLVYLLVSKGKFGMIEEIVKEYQRLVDEERGIERAEVVTAVPLTKEERVKVEEELSRLLVRR